MKTKGKLLPKLSVDGVVEGNATAGNFDDAARQLRVSELCSDVVRNANENFDDSPNTVITDVQRLEVVADMDVDTPISDMGLGCQHETQSVVHSPSHSIPRTLPSVSTECRLPHDTSRDQNQSMPSGIPAAYKSVGGPRYMYSRYLDALAICRVHGNPSFFITYTCNLKRPEITEYMADFSLLTTTDRADIVDRVFEMKIQEFIKYLRDVQPFGKTVVLLYTIEFQKRGLPHCHTLLWIHDAARVHRDEDIDMYVLAELPSKEMDPECYRIVSELMMHGPCRLACPSAPCTPNGVDYKKHFPKEYCNRTYTDKDCFVHYRRRDTSAAVLKQHVELDNQDVYVCQPKGFIDDDHPSYVYKLKKVLNGLKQVPRAWYDELSKFLLHNHFFKGTFDLTLFIRRFQDDVLVVQVNVDDIIFGSTHPRPDIVHATCLCARYQAKPTEKHLKEVKRIFRYLQGTINTGLWNTKDSGFELTGFSDADYLGCKDTFKSTFGGSQFLGEKLVSWSSKKQDCTALSTAKAEYVSLSACCAQVLWMRTQLTGSIFGISGKHNVSQTISQDTLIDFYIKLFYGSAWQYIKDRPTVDSQRVIRQLRLGIYLFHDPARAGGIYPGTLYLDRVEVLGSDDGVTTSLQLSQNSRPHARSSR
nr:DNA helicase [Tanacetum cinerariifolium]